MSTIKQRTTRVAILDGASHIEVRRMKWKDARAFMQKLGIVLGSLFCGSGLAGATQTQSGTVRLDLTSLDTLVGKLPELIQQSDELLALVIAASTELPPEKFDELDMVDAAAVLAKAVELNCDAELKNSFAGMVSAVTSLMPAEPRPALTNAESPTPMN